VYAASVARIVCSFFDPFYRDVPAWYMCTKVVHPTPSFMVQHDDVVKVGHRHGATSLVMVLVVAHSLVSSRPVKAILDDRRTDHPGGAASDPHGHSHVCC
jgi:hypothetical protein